MNEIASEILIVFGLILVNGFFSSAEMAFVSLRKTRVKQLAREGKKSALLAEKMLQRPEGFLATTQVGITLVSTIASAFAGVRVGSILSQLLKASNLSFIASNAESISFTIVVIAITYFSIVIGELIPKSLGIKFSEKVALASAYPLYVLSQIVSPVTWLLTSSSNIILKPFGDKTSFSESNLTEEELRTILYESHKAGTIKKEEHELLDNVFDFGAISVNQVMTPRQKIFAVNAAAPFEANVKKIIESGYTRVPVYKDTIDNIIGIFKTKSLLQGVKNGVAATSFDGMLQWPLFIPAAQHINVLLKKMQKEKIHMAVITDEHGGVDGIVTIEDILEEIVGDINDEDDDEGSVIVRHDDDQYEVDGSMSIVDFNKYFKTHLPEDVAYTTISGLLLDMFESLADVGTKAVVEGMELSVKERTERTIKTIGVRIAQQ